MTIKNRLSRLEKVIKPGIKKTDLNYSRAFDTLAQALTEITGQEITGGEIEKQLTALEKKP